MYFKKKLMKNAYQKLVATGRISQASKLEAGGIVAVIALDPENLENKVFQSP